MREPTQAQELRRAIRALPGVLLVSGVQWDISGEVGWLRVHIARDTPPQTPPDASLPASDDDQESQHG